MEDADLLPTRAEQSGPQCPLLSGALPAKYDKHDRSDLVSLGYPEESFMRTPNILVVDDEPSVLKLMATALAKHDWQIHQARDAEAALALAAGLHCGLNVLVTDLVMPGMAGEELIRRIRTTCPHIDVVAFSGALPEGSLGLTNVHVLRKPANMSELATVIREVLSVQLS